MKSKSQFNKTWRSKLVSFRYRPYALFMGSALFISLVIMAVMALNTGRNPFGLEKIFAVLINPNLTGFVSTIIWEVRLPRVITAIFAGAALGISGAIFQSISRNPLGSPDIIGFTAGAASGAIFYLLFIGEASLGISVSAIIGGIATSVLVYLLSMKFGTLGSYRLILIGIGVGATLTAINGLMLVKGELNSAIAANIWLAGSLNARQWEHAIPLIVGVLILLPMIWLSAHKLSYIEMGDELAQQLGVNVARVRLTLTFYAVVLASLATAAAGPIAFIALAAPQLASRLTQNQGVPIISAALMGAVLLVAADLVSQILPINMALPIGLVTAFIGGMYLLWVVSRMR